ERAGRSTGGGGSVGLAAEYDSQRSRRSGHSCGGGAARGQAGSSGRGTAARGAAREGLSHLQLYPRLGALANEVPNGCGGGVSEGYRRSRWVHWRAATQLLRRGQGLGRVLFRLGARTGDRRESGRSEKGVREIPRSVEGCRSGHLAVGRGSEGICGALQRAVSGRIAR